MKTFLDWLLERRYRVLLVAIALAPWLPIASTALIVLETGRRGARQGMASAAVGTATVVLLSLVSGANLSVAAGLASVTFFAGVALGAPMQRAGTLSLGLQAALLIAAAIVAGITLVGPDPRQMFASVTAELTEVLQASGATPDEVALVQSFGGLLLTGAVFTQLVAPLLLGYWWLAVASGQKRFGQDFRELTLGRVLGAAGTAAIGLGLAFKAPLVQNLSALMLGGFVLQGLAVVHSWAHAGQRHVGFIVPVYVLLVTPLMVVVLLGLGALGLVDHWFELRARWRAHADNGK